LTDLASATSGTEFDFAEIPIIDCDSHISEPPDLWTSRLPAKWVDEAPKVVWDDRRQEPRWLVGRHKLSGVAAFAMAGWSDFPPSHPPSLDEADPGSWNATDRLQRLDEYGIAAQILYPNLLAFYMHVFMELDSELALACVRAYNDFLVEFASADPSRLIPLMFLPLWDIDASVAEMKRGIELGHRGIIFGVDLTKIGLPGVVDPHWEPLLALAQEAELPVNLHIGVSQVDEEELKASIRLVSRSQFAMDSALMMLGNATAVATLVTSDLCVRFPSLNWVSVESGCGWMPFLLEALDWQWLNSGAFREHPERDMPSAYFKRQIYGSFWFEQESIRRTVDLMAGNLMFETDFPHPTALCPGPASYAELPRVTAERALSGFPEETVRMVLHDTAARLYKVD
jgi:predicted TIM-barrel fold metal-dependent hydrolase